MVVCFQTHNITLDRKECKSLKQILQKASKIYCQPQEKIKLFFVDSKLSQTQIDSDSDLLSLNYLVKNRDISFKILISKSKDQLLNELIEKEVSQFLFSFYDDIAEKEIQRQLNKQLQSYFKQLYQNVLRKQARHRLNQIQIQQVSKYMNTLQGQVNQRSSFREIRKSCSIQHKSLSVSQKTTIKLLQNKQEKIEKLVKKILESMMPVMVQQLSYRMLEELNSTKELPTGHTLRSIDEEENLGYF